MKPPTAKKIPQEIINHNDVRTDNYHWMRNRDDEEVIRYLRAENEYTEAVMKSSESFREDLYNEMLGRIKETDLSVPVRHGEYYYYSRTEEGKQYTIYCRKYMSLDAPEQVILDLNILAEGKDYMRLGVFEVSPRHDLLAYSIDTNGSETYILRFIDLGRGTELSEEIGNTYYSAVWANDNRRVFYTILDTAKRPYKVYRHLVGTDPSQDEEVYHEPDDAYFIWLSKSRSEGYLLMNIESHTTSEVRYLDADIPDGEFKIFALRKNKIEYSIFHHSDSFFILTNEDAVNFKLMKTSVSAVARDNWKEVIPHRPEIKLDRIDLFRDYMVVYERREGFRTMRVADIANREFHDVEFPEPVYTFHEGENPEFDTEILRFQYSSLITPLSVYDYNMRERTRELKKRTEVLGGYDPEHYISERLFASVSGGPKIPISVVYKKGIERNGENPLFLYGYGAYGISMDPAFTSTRLSLLDRGFVFAIAHVRGGGELGRPWYEAGKLLNKQNTFSDFIACAEHLITERYSSPEKLAAMGGSAGGMLIGAVLNQRPDLFKAAVAKVPFVDVLTTMLDPSLPLTVIEYEEWGNPNEKEYYDYIKSYSPYDNIAAQKYPHLLVIAGLNDPRVQFWEPAKWTAKLRDLKTDDTLLLLKTDMESGHGGASGRYDYLRDLAFEYAFVLEVVGRR
jgi:oligopeptidase B